MAFTGKRRRPIERDLAIKRDAKLVIIATEGQKTEKLYFINFNDSRVRVRILPSVNGRSSPAAVFSALEAFATEYEIAEGDELWLVVDVDHWVVNGNLQPVARECKQKKYKIAISNPCFELWLLLHFEEVKDAAIGSGALVKLIKNHVSYSKSKLDFDKYVDHVDDAIVRAKKITSKSDIPNNPGTNVFRLVQSLKGLRSR